MTLKKCLACWLLLFLPFCEVTAQTVPDLYAARIPVEIPAEPVRPADLQAALKQVLIKLAGDSRTVRESALKKIKTPENYVQRFGYKGNEKQTWLLVNFDPETLNPLLAEQSITIWNADGRPTVLLWLVLAKGEEDANFIDPMLAPDIEEILLAQSQNRGLPVLFPLFDLSDLNAIKPADIQADDEASIRLAADRYGLPIVLTGYLHTAADGTQTEAQWRLLLNEQSSRWRMKSDTLKISLQAGIDEATNRIAEQFLLPLRKQSPTETPSATEVVETLPVAETPTDDQSLPDVPLARGNTFDLLVTGVTSLADHVQAQRYLAGLDIVASLRLKRMEGDKITFTVTVKNGGHAALARVIQLERTLQPYEALANQPIYRLKP